MNERSERARNAQMIFGVLITAAIVAAFWIGGSPEWAIPAAIVMLGFIAAMGFSDRSQTAEVMYGIGDERTRDLYRRALAVTGLVMLGVIVVWYLVTVAEGDPNQTLGVLAALFNAGLIAISAVLSRRS